MSLLRVISFNVFLKSIKILYSAPLLISKMPFYAVAKGRTPGIFMTWPDCEAQVKGFPGARYKKFDSVAGAQDFISAEGEPSTSAKSKKPNNQLSAKASNSNLKRTHSTSSNIQENSVAVKPKSKSEASAGYAKEKNDSDEDFSDDSDDLNTIISKQMDDIEKRLQTFEKGVDKIIKKSVRKTILIDPPQNKRKKTSDGEFEMDNDGYVQVYTDGACSANGKTGARAGLGVYWGDGHPLNISEPVSGRATNNCGEIQAATKAIKLALQNGVDKLSINTDSKFVINSVTKWMPGKTYF